MNTDTRRTATPQSGFTIVELVIAVLLLSIGVLALAGTSGFVIRSVSLSDLRTERAAALQTAIERVRAMPYDSVASGMDSIGRFRVDWNATMTSQNGKDVRFISTGPGFRSGGGTADLMPVVEASVADTFFYAVSRP